MTSDDNKPFNLHSLKEQLQIIDSLCDETGHISEEHHDKIDILKNRLLKASPEDLQDLLYLSESTFFNKLLGAQHKNLFDRLVQDTTTLLNNGVASLTSRTYKYSAENISRMEQGLPILINDPTLYILANQYPEFVENNLMVYRTDTEAEVSFPETHTDITHF